MIQKESALPLQFADSWWHGTLWDDVSIHCRTQPSMQWRENRDMVHFCRQRCWRGCNSHTCPIWDNALSQQCVYKWIDMFIEGRTSVTDSELLWCLSTITSDDKHEQARAMILTDRTVTITDTATVLDTHECSAHSIVHDILGFH
jgi:hypothetical protein